MKHIWTWLAHESTTGHVSLAVSILAFVVAFWAGYQAKRSASATEKQARVASEQLQQSMGASLSAEKAAKEAKAVTWHDINDRLMERAARVVIGVEDLRWPPILAKDILDEPEYPRSAEPDQPKVLNSRSDRYSQLYYWVRGVILNEDTRSIQFICLGGIRLIEGTTSLMIGEIKIPPKMHPREGRYLLAPGRSALFEWRAALTIEQWIEVYNESERARVLAAGVFVYPAGDPDTASYVRIELADACPLAIYSTDNEKWRITNLPVCAQVKPPRLVPPKALTQLLLTLDDSGEARNNPRTWDLDPWQRDLLDWW